MLRPGQRLGALVAPALAGAVLACAAAPSPGPGHGAVELKTTDGAIALGNLSGEIGTLEAALGRGALDDGRLATLIELLGMRGQVLGSISDYERALALSEELVRRLPEDAGAYLARAHARSTFHRFDDALADLDQAAHRGKGDAADAARAAILQATGRYDEALVIRRRLAAARGDIQSLGGLAALLGERGALDEAERTFAAARRSYRDVSPFPIAFLEFQEGLIWMREGQLERARGLFAAAHDRQTAYVYATTHLGEVEAALGNTPEAVRHLTNAATAAEDPDPAAALAWVLAQAGRESEAAPWRARARSRYDALASRHPEAFADHFTEFWLGAGGDAVQALAWARKNLEVRRTPWAWLLAGRAALAADDAAFACDAAEQALAFHHATPELGRLARDAAQACGRTPKGS